MVRCQLFVCPLASLCIRCLGPYYGSDRQLFGVDEGLVDIVRAKCPYEVTISYSLPVGSRRNDQALVIRCARIPMSIKAFMRVLAVSVYLDDGFTKLTYSDCVLSLWYHVGFGRGTMERYRVELEGHRGRDVTGKGAADMFRINLSLLEKRSKSMFSIYRVRCQHKVKLECGVIEVFARHASSDVMFVILKKRVLKVSFQYSNVSNLHDPWQAIKAYTNELLKINPELY
nr:hypothetical protein Iba_chr04cCG11840 [Ipomoea batatas]